MNDDIDEELEKLLARQERRTKHLMKMVVITFGIMMLAILAFLLQDG